MDVGCLTRVAQWQEVIQLGRNSTGGLIALAGRSLEAIFRAGNSKTISKCLEMIGGNIYLERNDGNSVVLLATHLSLLVWVMLSKAIQGSAMRVSAHRLAQHFTPSFSTNKLHTTESSATQCFIASAI